MALEPVIEGLNFPTAMTWLPSGDRLVCERAGQIRRHTDDGLVDVPFLDVSDVLAPLGEEKGLLGIELHPSFPDPPRMFVRYSATTAAAGIDDSFSHSERLSEFEVTSVMDGVVPDSERVILDAPEPGSVHNAGDLAFGPDGYLYVPLGDGQRTNIEGVSWSWWYDQGEAAQQTEENLLGGILRIDVDERDGDRGYGIPDDNPLVGKSGRDEYYAWGLRNPYRISFDGDKLFIGDVGEHIRESVYIGEVGANYGWPILEGSSCPAATSIGHKIAENPLNVFNPKSWLAQTNRISPVKICPTPSSLDDSFPDPIVEYQRPGSRAVTGGYVYRGDAMPDLRGRYLFGDFIPPAPLFSVDDPEAGVKSESVTEYSFTHTDNGRLNEAIGAFARDPDGEVYLLTTRFGEGSGAVRRLVEPE